MQVSIDLSLYPLAKTEYKDEIWQFIERLKKIKEIKVVSNGMSTQVFGEYDYAVTNVMAEIKRVHQAVGSAVFIIKLIAADRDRVYE
ncbi:hypothetical protein [Thalassotalea atypica]|uniref:hypothetical protein n=1 Tax=Thalassotalea atypica TaxID=2054316 RepID=UPI00257397BC|nr:hypothetical protein [Thalassotalea atypica]